MKKIFINGKEKKNDEEKVICIAPMAMASFSNGSPEDDADILIQSEAIKTDVGRYHRAKKVLKSRGL
ncbi:MAG: hypothetical protein WBA74_10425 [Cyclobacteriaceae bacterium]